MAESELVPSLKNALFKAAKEVESAGWDGLSGEPPPATRQAVATLDAVIGAVTALITFESGAKELVVKTQVMLTRLLVFVS